jgi:SAM-dependent methyltransferase
MDSDESPRRNLRERISHRLFTPQPLDFFFNPVYLIRRPLFQWLRDKKSSVTGDVLDFGCGSMPYKDLLEFADSYTGLDLGTTEHGLSKPDVTFDGRKIPFDAEHFDTVVMCEVLDDLEDPSLQLGEIHRVLKPGGVLLLTTSFVWELHEEPYDIARYTEHGLRHILERAGFEIQEMRKLGHYTRTLGQMTAMYWYQTLGKIPGGVLVGVAVAAFVQLVTLAIEHLLPKRRELYLSNVAIVRRT